MKRDIEAARRAWIVLLAEIGGISRFATGPAFSHVNPGNLREISVTLLQASDVIELEIERRLDAYDCEAEGRRS